MNSGRRLLLGLTLLNSVYLRAQVGQTILPAPIPTPLITAKDVFIANGGSDPLYKNASFTFGPNRAYDEFYAEMKKTGKFRLVATPADADLVCEISMTATLLVGTNLPVPEVRLQALLIDAKTHIVVWRIVSSVETSTKQNVRDQNFDKALDHILKEVQRITQK